MVNFPVDDTFIIANQENPKDNFLKLSIENDKAHIKTSKNTPVLLNNIPLTNNSISKPKGRVAVLGDSISEFGYVTDTTGNVTYRVEGIFNWVQNFLGFPFIHEIIVDPNSNVTYSDNYGIGGDTTDNMLIRVDSVISQSKPDFIFFNGGTNDIQTGRTYDEVVSDLEGIFTKILNNGIGLFVLPIFPRGDSNDWTTQQKRDTHLAVNKWIMEFCQRNNNILFLDVYEILVDRTDTVNGDIIGSYTTDDLHFNGIGAGLIGKEVADQLSSIFGKFNPQLISTAADRYSVDNPYGNIIANGLLYGTGGTAGTGVTGDVADSFSISREGGSNITGVASKITDPSDSSFPMQRITVTTTGASGIEFIEMRTDPTTYTESDGIVEGEYYEAMCKLNVSDSSGELRYIMLELWNPISPSIRYRWSGTFNPYPNFEHKIFVKTPPILAEKDKVNSFRLSLFVGLNNGVANSGGLTVDVGRMTMKRMINKPRGSL